MEKIHNLFEMDYSNGRRKITRNYAKGSEWVLNGDFIPYIKRDGTSCMIKGGKLYKRFDNKKKLPIKSDWIKCMEEPDPITKHWTFWVPVDKNNPQDKWHNLVDISELEDGTYELVGKGIQGNAEQCETQLIKHDSEIAHTFPVDLNFENIKKYFENNNQFEGVVLHSKFEPKKYFKIKLKDFEIKRVKFDDYFLNKRK